jgi:hypothetical protein
MMMMRMMMMRMQNSEFLFSIGMWSDESSS